MNNEKYAFSLTRVEALLYLREPILWVATALLILFGFFVYVYISPGLVVETDDAFIQADTVTIVPKVSGYISALYVNDNSRIRKGQLLLEIDPRDYQTAYDLADAEYHGAQAMLQKAQARLTQQTYVINAAQASVESARATMAFSQQQLTRYGSLKSSGAGSAERLQEAQSDIKQKLSQFKRDTASLDTAKTDIAVLQADVLLAMANVSKSKAALQQASLNLSYTKIYAPVDGTVANRSVQSGDYLSVGQTLFSAVPNEMFVIANFKETQISNLRVGQPVDIRVDAYPNIHLTGKVDSLQVGTGSNFALLPPENSSGNFVKVVQRLPVKITLNSESFARRLLAPGMSVEPAITISDE